jgi:hypothetical protein
MLVTPHAAARLRKAASALSCLLFGACSAIQPAEKAAIDYNRSFAKARDEVLVLNVLRASERQPLQFSTISGVQGGIKSGATVTLPFTNLIGGPTAATGGGFALSPSVEVTNRNPAVSIVPLGSKEFVQGISRPISILLVDHLLAQGWPREVVLALTIGGVVCPDGTVELNEGEDREVDGEFIKTFSGATGFSVVEAPTFATLRMSDKDAMSFIKDGAGANHEIKRVTGAAASGKQAAEAQAEIEVVTPERSTITGLEVGRLCDALKALRPPRLEAGSDTEAAPAPARSHPRFIPTGEGSKASGGDEGADQREGVLMRSVQAIFNYLGRVHRSNSELKPGPCLGDAPAETPQTILFNLRLSCTRNTVPVHTVVETSFLGRHYYVPLLRDADKDDRTLDTLSLLSNLIDLQTSEASLRASTPTIAIAQ